MLSPRHSLALPEYSRSALDDALILLRLALLYALLGLFSHYGATTLIGRLGSRLNIDTQFLLLDALFATLMILGSLLVAMLLTPSRPLSWLFGKHICVSGLVLALTCAAIMTLLAEPLAGWLDIRAPQPLSLNEEGDAPRAITPLLELHGGQLLGALLIAIVWVPLAEEIIFRGWLFKALQRTRPGLLLALPASSLIFALLHSFYSPGGILVIALLGLFLGWLRWRYDQLWLCLAAHAAYNGLTLLLVGLG